MPIGQILRLPLDAYRRRTAFDLATLSRRFGIAVAGVLHVGANMGQEAEVYAQLGARRVIWIEGFDEFKPGDVLECVKVVKKPLASVQIAGGGRRVVDLPTDDE